MYIYIYIYIYIYNRNSSMMSEDTYLGTPLFCKTESWS